MKELTIGQKAKLYDEVVNKLKGFMAQGVDPLITRADVQDFFPELRESEDERIRKEIIEYIKDEKLAFPNERRDYERWLAWFEKQGNPAKLSEDEQNRFAKGVLTSCALSFINYLDAHKYEGKMCVSNGECEDIENAFHNAMWNKLHRYYCKYIEKQGKQKPNPYSGTSFEYNGHTWGMCARDGGVEILIDGHIKGRVFTNDSNAKEMFIKALERVEEQNAKGYKLTDCDKKTWWEDFKVYTSCTIEQKPVWSEEDEKMLNSIIEDFGDGKTSNMLQEYFLKTLKDRVQPQTTWKPSDEQMKVLDVAIKSSHLTTAEYNGLVKLREQLKKLREE